MITGPKTQTRSDNWHSPHSGCSEDIDVQVFRVWELKDNSNAVNGRLLRLSFVFRITKPFSWKKGASWFNPYNIYVHRSQKLFVQTVMPILPRLFRTKVHFHHVLHITNITIIHRELLHAYMETEMASEHFDINFQSRPQVYMRIYGQRLEVRAVRFVFEQSRENGHYSLNRHSSELRFDMGAHLFYKGLNHEALF